MIATRRLPADAAAHRTRERPVTLTRQRQTTSADASKVPALERFAQYSVRPILYPVIVKSLVTATWPSRETRHAYLPGAKPVELGANFQAHTGQRVSLIGRPV
jgi:hypothetical protein